MHSLGRRSCSHRLLGGHMCAREARRSGQARRDKTRRDETRRDGDAMRIHDPALTGRSRGAPPSKVAWPVEIHGSTAPPIPRYIRVQRVLIRSGCWPCRYNITVAFSVAVCCRPPGSRCCICICICICTHPFPSLPPSRPPATPAQVCTPHPAPSSTPALERERETHTLCAPLAWMDGCAAPLC